MRSIEYVFKKVTLSVFPEWSDKEVEAILKEIRNLDRTLAKNRGGGKKKTGAASGQFESPIRRSTDEFRSNA